MKLSKIAISNFRNLANVVLELGSAKFVCLRGGNFQGKSSIKQAISMLLSPSTEGLNVKGDGYTIKIKRGETKSVIVGDIQGKAHLVQRTVVLNTNTTGRTESSKCIDTPDWHPLPFENMLKANRDAILVAANTDHFLRMDEKDQKNLLAKLALPSSYDFPTDKIAAVDKAIGAGAVDFTSEPFAVIDKAYSKLYAERTVVNRQVKDFAIPEPLQTSPGVDSKSIEKELGAARDARQEILNQKDAAVRTAGDGEVERAKLQTRIDNLQEKINEENGKLSDIEGKLLTEAKHKELVKIANGKEQYDKLALGRTELATKITDDKRETQKWNAVPDDQSECGSCGQPVNQTYIAEMRKFYSDRYKALMEEDTAFLQEMKVLGDVEGAGAALAKHEMAKKERASIQSILAEKTKLLQDGKAKLQAMGTKADPADEFIKPLASADAEIVALTNQLRPVIAAEERLKEIAIKKEQLGKLQAKAAAIDELVTYFGKDGIKAKLLDEHIGAFEESINETLAAWGYEFSLSIEPYQLNVKDTRGVTTPVTELSGSEQLMFLAAFQCAVSRASGIGLVILDRMDTFLPEQRSKANRVLYESVQNGILDQVWIIVSDENTEVPDLPNAAFYRVEDGAVQRLGKG